MTGVNKVRAKWVSFAELSQRRTNGACLQCGRKGHIIANCNLLPAKRPETTVQAVTFIEDNAAVEGIIVGENELKG